MDRLVVTVVDRAGRAEVVGDLGGGVEIAVLSPDEPDALLAVLTVDGRGVTTRSGLGGVKDVLDPHVFMTAEEQADFEASLPAGTKERA